MTNIFTSIFDTTLASSTVLPFFICLAVSLIAGVFLALMYSRKNRASKSFLLATALLPAIVCVVIMMVNGNIGAGIAVAGAFSLIRFRSAPGSAREISTLFIAMGTGIIIGMGYIAYAVIFTVLLALILNLLTVIPFGGIKDGSKKDLRITIPEDLNYNEVFDDILNEFTNSSELISVKTSNMGSLFKLHYNVSIKDPAKEKDFMDSLRTRNGNLEVSLSKCEMNPGEL
ncbi:MAG: DUF4956 domain-containing protein [Lachnospiraceae bacterium]|nr:DUF4956 domain-containing protein [Lachnospiraceae bacterium]